MATGWLGEDPVVERSGVPEPDEAMLNPFGLIGDTLMVVTRVAATDRLAVYLKRGTRPERKAEEQACISWVGGHSTGRCNGPVGHRACRRGDRMAGSGDRTPSPPAGGDARCPRT
jgi:hypothetical protein